jgi:hypothetical protein
MTDYRLNDMKKKDKFAHAQKQRMTARPCKPRFGCHTLLFFATAPALWICFAI